ncbi:MAG: hypothetical protein QF719_09510 [Chloroflexota bacterium]|jgi:hypothetical protein|nr:hypothetical protein [Chloroflexota bacterium]MDP6509330.1 hypothetical protein [Chloroflexota bacterium]MDP6758424.1 hypothetical protein [Chloroflexota bacterium]
MKTSLGKRRTATAAWLLALLAVSTLFIFAACDREETTTDAPTAAAAEAPVPAAVPEQSAAEPAAPSAPQPTPTPEATAAPAPEPTVTAPPPAAPTVQPVVDFGDAPDGDSAGYSDTGIQAAFPSLAAGGGLQIAQSGFETLGIAVAAFGAWLVLRSPSPGREARFAPSGRGSIRA